MCISPFLGPFLGFLATSEARVGWILCLHTANSLVLIVTVLFPQARAMVLLSHGCTLGTLGSLKGPNIQVTPEVSSPGRIIDPECPYTTRFFFKQDPFCWLYVDESLCSVRISQKMHSLGWEKLEQRQSGIRE